MVMIHDQGDAKWTVIRGPLRGHNETPIVGVTVVTTLLSKASITLFKINPIYDTFYVTVRKVCMQLLDACHAIHLWIFFMAYFMGYPWTP
jgi:hypothetical protein